MKGKWRTLLRVVVFWCVFAVLFAAVSTILYPDRTGVWNNYYTVRGFYKEPRDTVETIFLGTSVMLTGMNAMQLYEDYGFCTYNLSTSSQPMLASYYWLQEAYRLHGNSLRNVVVEVSGVRTGQEIGGYHNALDDMHLSPVKLHAIWEYTKGNFEDALNFIVPMFMYHDRWKELESGDFTYTSIDPTNGSRGYYLRSRKYSTERVFHLSPSLQETSGSGTKLIEESVDYIKKIIAFCREHDLELTLMRMPTAKNWSTKLYEAVKLLADEYQVTYIDFNVSPYPDEIQFVYSLDTSDRNHLNYYGATKVTKWMGEYLAAKGATDVRGMEKYSFMETQAAAYQQNMLIPMAMADAEDIETYLQNGLKLGDQYTIALISRGEAADGLTNEQRAYFDEVGLHKLANFGRAAPYVGILCGGEVMLEKGIEDYQFDKDGPYIRVVHTLPDGKSICVENRVVSGFYKIVWQALLKNEVVQSGDPSEVELDERGLHCILIDNRTDSIVHTRCFDTHLSEAEERYNSALFEATEQTSAECSLSERIKWVLNTNNAPVYEKDELFRCLSDYWSDSNYMILIAASDEASEALSVEARDAFATLGLQKLSELKSRQTYIALICGGEVLVDQSGPKDEELVFQINNIFIRSSTYASAKPAKMGISDTESVPCSRGLNIMIYSKKLCYPIGMYTFDTYVTEQQVPEQLDVLFPTLANQQ